MSPSGGSPSGRGEDAVGLPIAPDNVHAAALRWSAAKIEHFIGRHAELDALRDAFTALLAEQAIAVHVRGRAGMGKSALIHHFLMGLRHREGAVVLRGRCAPGEAAPFKAFAALADTLGRYLRRVPADEVQRLVPREMHTLAELFPELSGVPAGSAAARTEGAPGSLEIRQRGFTAMRQLLWRIAERKPLIVSVEDLQWIDVDSVALLVELLRSPAAPAMLFLGSYRSEEIGSSAPLRMLLEQQAHMGCDLREIDVGPLAPAEAEELALALLSAWDASSRVRAGDIARSSEGNPRLIGELCRAPQASPPEVAGGVSVALGGALHPRLGHLPDQARRLLEVVAVAGVSIDQAIAVKAAKLVPEEHTAALLLLRTEDLVRTRRSDGRDTIEAAHDDLREAIAAWLSPSRREECHLRLARALEEAGGSDPEVLSNHWLGAGNAAKAGHLAVTAAERAAETLSFERAARLYQRAIDLLNKAGDPAVDRALSIRCADALVCAGQGAEAARVYASAAEGATPALTLELRRRAAEQHLRSGHIDEGLALLRAVLRAVGLTLPQTPRRALLSLLLHRTELRVRGLRFHEHAAADVPPEDLARIDACWSVTVGLSTVDPIRFADFSTRTLLFALRAGEPRRIARALAFEAFSASMVGGSDRDRAEELVGVQRTLAERLDDPHALGLSMMVSGMLEAFAGGRWKAASRWYEQAEEMFSDHCAGVAWELATTQLFMSWARFYRGHLGALARTLPAVLRGAEQRDDRYAVAALCTASAWIALVKDDVSGARRAIVRAMSRWPQAGFHLEHFAALLAEAHVDRYAGRPGAAWKRMQARWPALERSLLLRLQNHRVMAHAERGATALAVAEGAADPEPLVQVALRDAAALARERMAWSDPYAALIRAGVAALHGDRARALGLLEEAASGFDAADMPLYAAAARRRAGEISEGERGLQLILVADAFMAREDIKSPARWAAMLAPGFARQKPAG